MSGLTWATVMKRGEVGHVGDGDEAGNQVGSCQSETGYGLRLSEKGFGLLLTGNTTTAKSSPSITWKNPTCHCVQLLTRGRLSRSPRVSTTVLMTITSECSSPSYGVVCNRNSSIAVFSGSI